MLVASAYCPHYADRMLGFSMPALARRVRDAQARVTAETSRREGMEASRRETLAPEQRASEDTIAATYAKTVVPGYTVAGPTLTPAEKQLQQIILARDYDALFRMVPLAKWKPTWQLGKYSFTGNGARRYVPFTEADIKKFVFSPYYSKQPGHVCPEAQLKAGAAAHWKKSAAHKARYPASDWKHIWPMYPGGGYPGQTYGCERYRPSRWVRIRKKVYIAAAIIAAVYLGPIVLEKLGGLLGAGGGEAAGGIVGAGTKAGAAAIKIGKGGQLVATTAKGAGWLGTVKSGVGYYNQANTVNAIIKGEMPPTPIGISGDTFAAAVGALAKDLAQKEIADELGERAGEYLTKKLTEAEERALQIEIANLQRQMAALVPRGTPTEISPELAPTVREKYREMQNIERDRGVAPGVALLALAVPAVFLLAG